MLDPQWDAAKLTVYGNLLFEFCSIFNFIIGIFSYVNCLNDLFRLE